MLTSRLPRGIARCASGVPRASSSDGAAALERLSFSLERGKRYALIGASGSGKSTLLRVLAGLYPAERIALTLDDGPTRVSTAETAQLLRTRATLIPQGALESACATDFVRSTPAGLGVAVNERAASLDPATEARVYTNLFAAFADACVISSVHRLSLLGRFDHAVRRRVLRCRVARP